MNWAVIMAGGVGERFWPMSRRQRPKQLLPIVGKRTMIQQTVARLQGVVSPSQMMVVTTAAQAPLVRQQVPRIKHIVAEPVGRNTAPCVGLAAALIAKHDPSAVIAVVPADSYIPDATRYRQVVSEALELAAREKVLVTIGIQPTSPHTGYGYIQLGDRLNDRFWRARRFVEKPDRATAEQFLASKQYRWNAGMFVWSVAAIREAFQEHQPAMWAQIAKIAAGGSLKRIYPTLEKISVDYAIMEKAGNVVVANGDFDWDDVGDWAAIERHARAAGPDFVSVDSSGCIVAGETGHTVAAVGVNDLIIVHTSDATLVCRKSEAQRVRDIVKQLGSERKYRKLL
jgi:mannose-1-phosphate guanylyltransferase